MLLFYNTQRTENVYFSKIYYHTSFQESILEALRSLPPHKFVRLPYWYCPLQKIKKHDFRMASNGVRSIKISSKCVKRFSSWIVRTDTISPACVHFLHIVQRTYKNHMFWIQTPELTSSETNYKTPEKAPVPVPSFSKNKLYRSNIKTVLRICTLADQCILFTTVAQHSDYFMH
jgi:hypothetical protein